MWYYFARIVSFILELILSCFMLFAGVYLLFVGCVFTPALMGIVPAIAIGMFGLWLSLAIIWNVYFYSYLLMMYLVDRKTFEIEKNLMKFPVTSIREITGFEPYTSWLYEIIFEQDKINVNLPRDLVVPQRNVYSLSRFTLRFPWKS